jgi:hypothetical protein
MKPTAHLRFVEKTEIIEQTAAYTTGRKVTVLQQWWASDPDCEDDFILQANGDWRDVPLEKTE